MWRCNSIDVKKKLNEIISSFSSIIIRLLFKENLNEAFERYTTALRRNYVEFGSLFNWFKELNTSAHE